MTKEQAPAQMMGWVKDHLWQIAAAGLVLYTGYLSAMNEAQSDIAALRQDVNRLEKTIGSKLDGRHDFMNDAAARVNYLCQDSPDCRKYYGALRVPG